MKTTIREFENEKLENREDWIEYISRWEYDKDGTLWLQIGTGKDWDEYSVVLELITATEHYLIFGRSWFDKASKRWVSDSIMKAKYKNMKKRIIEYWYE